MMATGVLLFVSETLAMDELGLVLKQQLRGKENKFWTNFSHSPKSLTLAYRRLVNNRSKSYTTKYLLFIVLKTEKP